MRGVPIAWTGQMLWLAGSAVGSAVGTTPPWYCHCWPVAIAAWRGTCCHFKQERKSCAACDIVARTAWGQEEEEEEAGEGASTLSNCLAV